MTERIYLHLTIRGQVQGVGYRAFLQSAAMRLSLDGWVRNRRDGTVEALVVGPKDKVDDLVAQARRGPRGSRVEEIAIVADDGEGNGLPEGFAILPSA